jgi:hypothetical protein
MISSINFILIFLSKVYFIYFNIHYLNMSSLVPVNLHLSKHQVRKAAQGRPIQISAENLHKGTHTIHVHPENHKKIQKAKRVRKGVRLHLSHHEMEGSGLFDFLRNAWNTVKNKVIDTQFYQNTVRPIAKQGVNQLIDTFVPAPARDIAHKGADFVGDKTGAFGLRQHSLNKKRVALSNNMSRMIAPEHPSFNPGLPLRPIGGEVGQYRPPKKTACSKRVSSRGQRKSKRKGKSQLSGSSFLPSGY